MDKPSTGNRKLDSARDRAASKIIWGEDDEEVYQFLRKEGVAPDLANQFIDDAHRERAAIIRQRSLMKFIAGGIGALVCGGALFFLDQAQTDARELGSGYANRRMGQAIWVIGGGFIACGGYALTHGLALLTGKTMGSAMDD